MDIVESLQRAAAGASYSDPMRSVLFTCGEAADEIGRLREAMRGATVIANHAGAEIAQLRLQIKEGCEAARNFGADIVGDDDEPKWCVAAAVVAERKRGEAENERLQAALKRECDLTVTLREAISWIEGLEPEVVEAARRKFNVVAEQKATD